MSDALDRDDNPMKPWKSWKDTDYPYLTKSQVDKVIPLMIALGVSEVARSSKGFIGAYNKAGSPAGLARISEQQGKAPWYWWNRREGFNKRHINQVTEKKRKGDTEPLWVDGSKYGLDKMPSRRHLALIAWYWTPHKARFEQWLKDNSRALAALAKEYSPSRRKNPVPRTPNITRDTDTPAWFVEYPDDPWSFPITEVKNAERRLKKDSRETGWPMHVMKEVFRRGWQDWKKKFKEDYSQLEHAEPHLHALERLRGLQRGNYLPEDKGLFDEGMRYVRWTAERWDSQGARQRNPISPQAEEKLRQMIASLAEGRGTRDDQKRLEKYINSLAPENGISTDQLEVLAAKTKASGGDYYKLIAGYLQKGLEDGSFDPQKANVKQALNKQLSNDLRRLKKEQEKGESVLPKRATSEAAKYILNTQTSVLETKAEPDDFLTAWLAAQGVQSKDLSAFATPSLDWTSNASPSWDDQQRAKAALEGGKTTGIVGSSLQRTDEEGKAIFDLADPSSLMTTPQREEVAIDVEQFGDMLKEAGDASKKAEVGLWNMFWQTLPQSSVEVFMRAPDSLPPLAWTSLGSRLGDWKGGESGRDMAQSIKQIVDVALQSGTKNAQKIIAPLPQQVVGAMQQGGIGDGMSGKANLTWTDILKRMGIEEIPLAATQISDATYKRAGVSPTEDDRGVLFDLGLSLQRTPNPAKKKAAKKKSTGKKRTVAQEGSLLTLLMDAFEDMDDVSEEEIGYILEILEGDLG